jgi:hypothetical protein
MGTQVKFFMLRATFASEHTTAPVYCLADGPDRHWDELHLPHCG